MVVEGQTALISIGATPNTFPPATVSYSISGTATYGADYTLSDGLGLTATVTIPIGANAVSISVMTIADGNSNEKRQETLIVAVNQGQGYKSLEAGEGED